MSKHKRQALMLAAATLVLLGTTASALAQEEPERPKIKVTAEGKVIINGMIFESWQEYGASDYFRQHGKRCGTKAPPPGEGGPRDASDCSDDWTNPADQYDPSVKKYRIPVVVHVIQDTQGNGYLSEARIQSQIDILNEDYLALPGTPGEPGTDLQFEFLPGRR